MAAGRDDGNESAGSALADDISIKGVRGGLDEAGDGEEAYPMSDGVVEVTGLDQRLDKVKVPVPRVAMHLHKVRSPDYFRTQYLGNLGIWTKDQARRTQQAVAASGQATRTGTSRRPMSLPHAFGGHKTAVQSLGSHGGRFSPPPHTTDYRWDTFSPSHLDADASRAGHTNEPFDELRPQYPPDASPELASATPVRAAAAAAAAVAEVPTASMAEIGTVDSPVGTPTRKASSHAGGTAVDPAVVSSVIGKPVVEVQPSSDTHSMAAPAETGDAGQGAPGARKNEAGANSPCGTRSGESLGRHQGAEAILPSKASKPLQTAGTGAHPTRVSLHERSDGRETAAAAHKVEVNGGLEKGEGADVAGAATTASQQTAGEETKTPEVNREKVQAAGSTITPSSPGSPPLLAVKPPRRDIRRDYLTNLGMKRAVVAGPGGTRTAPPIIRKASSFVGSVDHPAEEQLKDPHASEITFEDLMQVVGSILKGRGGKRKPTRRRCEACEREKQEAGVGQGEGGSISTPICTHKHVEFAPSVSAVYIPVHSEYSDRVRRSYWNSASEIREMVYRNMIEFDAEEYDWQKVAEEDDMYYCEETGDFIHPIFFNADEEAREVKSLEPEEEHVEYINEGRKMPVMRLP